jgi:hypothetical protein
MSFIAFLSSYTHVHDVIKYEKQTKKKGIIAFLFTSV